MSHYEKVWTNITNGPNEYVEGGGGDNMVADWDLSLVRYIFVNGDGGNDANVGYIDAPAGTVFTPTQTDPVAVKTTHRINQIRPSVGAGRTVVVLLKARAGHAPYDLVDDEDGLGCEDRSACSGYRLMLTRGSDLTNSPADREQVGMVTSLGGPNDDGSFSVDTVGPDTSPGAGGMSLSLVGAALPDGWMLGRYRLRHEGLNEADIGTHYLGIKWGDATPEPRPTIVLTWDTITIITGDKVWFEEPGVVLHDYVEAQGARDVQYDNALVAAGLRIINGQASVGGSNTRECTYSNMWVDPSTHASLLCQACDTRVFFQPGYVDEHGDYRQAHGLGIWAPCESSLRGSGNDYQIQCSTFSSNDNIGSTAAQIECRNLNVTKSALQAYAIFDVTNVGVLSRVLAGNAYALISGELRLDGVYNISMWNDRGAQFAATDNQAGALYKIGASQVFIGAEPAREGYLIGGDGQIFTVIFDMTAYHPGQWVNFQVGFELIPVSYNSLCTTGFEVEGGITVLCVEPSELLTGIHFPGNVLPAPRCRLMQFPGFEGQDPIHMDVGLVVGQGADPGIVVPICTALNYPFAPVLGFTVCDTIATPDGTGGFVLVAQNGPGCLAIIAQGNNPEPGSPLYLSTTAGYVNPVPPDPRDGVLNTTGPRLVGYVNATGYLATRPTIYATWEPGNQADQVAMQDATTPFSKVNATLTDVPGESIAIQQGHVYAVEALLICTLGGADIGGQVAIGGDATGVAYFLHEIYQYGMTNGLEQVNVASAIGDGASKSYIGAATWVAWKITGMVRCTGSGYLKLRFAQAQIGADAPASVTMSILKVVEQN